MNSFRDILKRYFHLFIFLILQTTSIILIYNNTNYQHFVISTAMQGVIGPLQKFANFFYRHFYFSTENTYLAEQNMALLRASENMFIFSDDSLFSVFSSEQSGTLL